MMAKKSVTLVVTNLYVLLLLAHATRVTTIEQKWVQWDFFLNTMQCRIVVLAKEVIALVMDASDHV
jgi:hypothetical protein